MCCASVLKEGELMLNLLRNALSVLRNDLKCYGTCRTGAGCSGEKVENSTSIQVLLRHWFAVFQCTHRPPRARSTIAILYDSRTVDQVQSFQFDQVKKFPWSDAAGERFVEGRSGGRWLCWRRIKKEDWKAQASSPLRISPVFR